MTGGTSWEAPLVAEFELLARIRPHLAGDGPGIPLGVGDDAAVVEIDGRPVAVATDAVVRGVHADPDISSTADIGWKSIAVNASDLAAIGARTVAAVAAVQIPPGIDEDDVVGLYEGMEQAATRWSLQLVGGDIVTGPALSVAVTVLGELHGDAPLRRDGAQVGDIVILIGRLGTSAAGLALHRAGAAELLAQHPELLAVHRRPVAYPEGGRALVVGGAHACIDLSDGLGRDAAHIARASGVRLRIDEPSLPVPDGVRAAERHLGDDLLAVTGGEDLALLATLPPDRVPVVTEELRGTGRIPATIGRVEAGRGVLLTRADGTTLDISARGWEHGT